jgi:hypothetical protein
MVDPVPVLATFLGVAVAVADDRLIRLNRRMPLADFEEQNLVARSLMALLGEDAGWTALQACGIAAFALMILLAFVCPWIGWAVVAVLVVGLALVSFDLLHDGREIRLAVQGGYGLGIRRRMD